MNNSNQDPQTETLHALTAGAVLLIVPVLLIKFTIPIVLSLLFAALTIRAISNADQIVAKLKLLFAIVLNLTALTYISLGLPFVTGSENQFLGFFGKYSIQIFANAIKTWNTLAGSSRVSKKLFLIKNITWQEISALFWAGLILGIAVLIIYEVWILKQSRNPVGNKGTLQREASKFGPLIFKFLSFPTYPITKAIVSKLIPAKAILKAQNSGFIIGKSTRNDYRLTEKNINHHIQIVAPSGGGKTNILKNLIHDRIQKGHGVIFLDYKAEFEVAEFISKSADACGRTSEVRIFSLTNRAISVPYNPISHGSAAELQSRLMNAFTWSTEIYYKSKAESVLLKIFRALTEWRDIGDNTITLKTVFDVFTKKGYARELVAEIRDLGGSNYIPLEEVAAILDRPSEVKELQGLITNLEKVIYSGAGELLTTDAGEKAFTIEEAINERRITYFLMNSLSSKETAASIGKLLLQDLMGYVGRAYDMDASNRKPITIIVDEFAEFAIPEFPSFLNRVRGAGIGVVIAHQSRGDLKAVSDDYMLKIEANTNTKIIAGVTDPDDAQVYAEMIGTHTTTKETLQTAEEGILWITDKPTGAKSIREVEEFIIHPNKIKRIEQGNALVISRTVDTNYGIISIPRAQEFTDSTLTRFQIEQNLKEIRKQYLATVSAERKPNLKKPQKVSAALWD